MRYRLVMLWVGLLVASASAYAAEDPAAPECSAPTHAGRYCQFLATGWELQLNARLVQTRPGLAKRVLAEARQRLAVISTRLPAARLQDLRRVTVWIEDETSTDRAMYHTISSEFPRQHGYPAAKSGSVDIPNAEKFIENGKDQPFLLLHELAHAFHEQILGHDNPQILAAYRHAVDVGLYKNVLRSNHQFVTAYALTNEREYFAELTEAYFGENDFFPFNREELRTYDAVGFAALQALWEHTEPLREQRIATDGKGADCAQLPRSIEGRQPARILFRNRLAEEVGVFWLDYGGQRKAWATIPPGGLFMISRTYLTHPWLLVGSAGNCLGVALPDENGSWIAIGS